MAESPDRFALEDVIDRALPQTQCTRCGYPACRPYARAISQGEADFNQCPPGGSAGIIKLAKILGREPKALNPMHGVEGPVHLAVIDESACIGCTLCIQACPVDAIVGASKQMHTVVADWCTGCELCVPPCPVDCIAMVRAPSSLDQWNEERAETARVRYETRNTRLARERERKNSRARPGSEFADDEAARARRALVAAAVERARLLKAQVKPRNTGNLPPEIDARLKKIDAERARKSKDSK